MQLPTHTHPEADPIVVLTALAAEAGTTYEDLVAMLADRAKEPAEFSYPLAAEARQEAAALLRAGHDCQVGDYRLYADDGFIESSDAYGLPVLWSSETAAEAALQWVDEQYAHEEAERAEYAAWMS